LQVFFVSGSPKSGTTWLQRVLDAHPQVACSGEGHFVDDFITPLAQVMNRYNGRQRVMSKNVYEGRPYYQPVSQAEFNDLARHFILARMARRADGAQVLWIGDKTPRYAARLGELNQMFPACRIINIVRDPRDVLVSTLAHQVRVGTDGEYRENPAARDRDLRRAVAAWKDDVAPIRPFAEVNPGRLHSLRYEDMLSDPASEAARAFGFLDVSTAPEVIEEIVRATSFEAQTGRQRGEEDPSAFLRKGVVGDWVGKLEPWLLAFLDETCGELMRAYGYH
jgi:hypothetical protein